jgi:hypothetical protein
MDKHRKVQLLLPLILDRLRPGQCRFALKEVSWMLLRTSPIRRLSDSIVTDGSEMIRCEGRRDFSMSMID